ncbi:protein KRI1 homolog [Thrips palmi]|uniref:Protein KRI1 homolog n=1 Tax=Thrips palmi TaxID=161013 RepID=A0A6P8ZR47_THRPL|nr:protein KRI1 homolog [Thrips palmi]
MSKKLNLFDDNSDDDGEEASLSINKGYAKRYEEWREAEVKRTLENKLASGHYDDADESSSEEGEPDPDPEELNQVLSKDFFELISGLKSKDPKIYNPNVEFFKKEKEAQSSSAGKATKKQPKEKPLYLRDYERKIITERQGELSDESDTDIKEDPRSQSPTYVEEQRQLKESFKKALNDDDESGDEGGLLKKKEKTKAEQKKEEEDYIEWLKGNKASLPDKETEESLKGLKNIWNDPNLDEGEKFLRDYVLNKRYLEADDEPVDDGNVTDDDYQDKYMDSFEHKYNFRYEEPDREFLKRYPRTMEQSVRHRDTKRKEKRDALKKRKEEEKLVKREELKLLKSLKRKEIMQKIEHIKQITGNDELGLDADELEEEFDPEAHDRKMKELFNDDYYKDEDAAEDEEGLHLPPLEEELLDDEDVPDGNWDNWDTTENNDASAASQGEGYVPHCEDPDFNMDCDYDPATAATAKAQKESKRMSAREKRKLKRQSRFGRLVHKEKPVFDPKDKTFQQYVDEYYGMDYEDLIGDMPCRFKYKSVFPNSYGLTIDEILAADDKELNQWVSIKKAYTIRPESTERYEAKVYAEKARNEELKRKILPSLYKHETEHVNENDEKDKKKKKKKKHNKDKSKNADGTLVEDAIETDDQTTLQAEGSSKKKKKKQQPMTDKDESTVGALAGDANETVDLHPFTSQAQDSGKKKKKKQQLITGEDGSTVGDQAGDTNKTVDLHPFTSQAQEIKSSKKKKKKHQLITNEEGSTGVALEGDTSISKKKKKKEFNKIETATAQGVNNETTSNKMKRKHSDSGVQHQNGVKKAKTSFSQRGGGGKKNWKGNAKQEQNISDSRLKAYGLNPRRFKNFQKYGPEK